MNSGRPRILFVSHQASRTGAPMFLLHFLRWLRARNVVDFEILLGETGPLKPEFAATGKVWTPEGMAAVPRALHGYQLIYANTCLCHGLLTQLDCGGTPVVTHLHELDSAFEWLGAHRMALALRLTQVHVACARAVADSFSTCFGVPHESIAVHYEMIDAAAARASAARRNEAELRQRFNLPADAFVVVGCGTIDLRKGVDLFVQAAAALQREVGDSRPLRFVWIGGDSPSDLPRHIRHDVRKLGLEHSFILAGEQAEPHQLLSLGHVFWLTSREDPFPLVMLEAAALGLPVVAFDDSGGAREFSDFGGARVVPYVDPAALARATLTWLEAPGAAADFGRRAAELVDQRFQIEAVAPALLADLESWLGRSWDHTAIRLGRQRPVAAVMSGWSRTRAPHAAFINAHLERQERRREVQVLLKTGRKVPAMKQLIDAVQRTLAVSDPWIYCDGLVQWSQDLEPLDPNSARQLRAKAQQVATTLGVGLETFAATLR